MPEILPEHVPSPRILLAWDGTAYRPIHIDALGNVQVDVLGNANLDNALQSVATDRLIVRGEDQLYSYDSPLATTRSAVVSGADGVVDSDSPPDGSVWIVHHVAVRNRNSAITDLVAADLRGAVTARIYTVTIALAANTWLAFPCTVHLEHNDAVRVWFLGSLATDTCDVQLAGSVMTKEA